MAVIVTGAAGFIGSHTSRALLARGETVIGIDNLNDYYDVRLKHARLEHLTRHANFSFHQISVDDQPAVFDLASKHGHEVTGIIHLAAQAGVRYSLENPYAYVDANIMGQVVMLEMARRLPNLRHFVYASSSSVYGANHQTPFSVDHRVDEPISVYAATKRSCELMAHTYSHLYGLPTTGLRFFTVYGPWGRPDMTPFVFADAIMKGEPIKVFNHGDMWRDFTYIDDIVRGVVSALDRPPLAEHKRPPYRLYNLGNSRSEKLMDYIHLLEQALGRKAQLELMPMQPGDVPVTSADISDSRKDLGFDPVTPVADGLKAFADWYLDYVSRGSESPT